MLGNAGVPVTKKNLEVEKRIPDVLWEENRLDADAPMYEGQRVVPFGFGRIDTKPGAFEFQVFDHAGKARFGCVVARGVGAGVPVAPSRTRRSTSKSKPKGIAKTKTKAPK
jgi:hypothetical protein